jgi:hypothetical protein
MVTVHLTVDLSDVTDYRKRRDRAPTRHLEAIVSRRPRPS